MKNHMIKAGAAVIHSKTAHPAFNAEQIVNAVLQHKDLGILVFPELCLTGYTCADLFQQEVLLDETITALKYIAANTESIKRTAFVVGAPIRYENRLYNCAVWFSGGKIIGVIPKIHLPSYGEFYETRWFSSGRDLKNLTLPDLDNVPFGWDLLLKDESTGVMVGTEICEDLWVPDKPSTKAILAGADIIVNLSASDEVIGKQEYRRQIVSQQSAVCYCDYIYASAGCDESSTDMVFSGHCLIAENGKILCDEIYRTGEVYTAILDPDTCMFNRRHQNTFGMETTEEYRILPAMMQPICGSMAMVFELSEYLKKEKYPIARNPFVPSGDAERGKRSRDILQIQANGLATRVRNTGIKNLIIGISGGLDSTLALIVCHEAKKLVPDIKIIAYTLPNHGNTSSLTYENATRLMNLLADDCREVAIGEAVNEHLNAIGHGTEYKGAGDTTYENAQARMRTYILMDAANMENGLVVGTGDLSELALGWCTYNGDHMSMYAVNASVPKTLVQYICQAYADTCGTEDLKSVLYSICDTPISPELTPNNNGEISQKTEEKIGKYDLNDFFLYYTLRYGMEPEKLMVFALTAYPELTKEDIKPALERFYNRFFHQQFKRSCLPDGPKVGSVTLSPRGDWRMPSDASVGLWLDRVRNA